jgi:hypothetical protein
MVSASPYGPSLDSEVKKNPISITTLGKNLNCYGMLIDDNGYGKCSLFRGK